LKSITKILIEVLESDKYFEGLFGSKEKVNADAEYKIIVIPYSYYTKGPKKENIIIDELKYEEIAGFMIFKEVDGVKEFEAYTFKDHSRLDYIFLVYTLLENKLHLLAKSDKIEMFLNYGVKIDRTYDNYLGETIVVLDFANIEIKNILKGVK